MFVLENLKGGFGRGELDRDMASSDQAVGDTIHDTFDETYHGAVNLVYTLHTYPVSWSYFVA